MKIVCTNGVSHSPNPTLAEMRAAVAKLEENGMGPHTVELTREEWDELRADLPPAQYRAEEWRRNSLLGLHLVVKEKK